MDLGLCGGRKVLFLVAPMVYGMRAKSHVNVPAQFFVSHRQHLLLLLYVRLSRDVTKQTFRQRDRAIS
jgi:hypothetical protein